MKHMLVLYTSLLALSQGSLGAVSDAIKQLEQADLESAKGVVKSLNVIAADKNNAESKTAEALSRVIKLTFTAEFNVQQAILGFDKAIETADELERQGQVSMKPNALGSVNRLGAEAKFKAARETRTKAVKQVRDANAVLATSLNALSKESQNTQLTAQDRETLQGAVATVETRTLKPTETLCVQMGQRAEQLTEEFETENAAQEQAKVDEQGRDAALAAMRQAIKTRKAKDEAYAMEMLSKYAPDAVKDYTDFLAAKAASARAAADAASRRKVDDLEQRLNRVGVPR